MSLIKSTIKANQTYFLLTSIFFIACFVAICMLSSQQFLYGIKKGIEEIGMLMPFPIQDLDFLCICLGFFMITILFSIVYAMVMANRMFVKGVETGYIACYLSAVHRFRYALTNAFVLICSCILLWGIVISVQYLVIPYVFKGMVSFDVWLQFDLVCFLYQVMICGLCFLCSIACNSRKKAMVVEVGGWLLLWIVSFILFYSFYPFRISFLFYILSLTGIDLFLYLVAIFVFQKRNLPV